MSCATIVGSGPNGLAAALTLADAGMQVTVLEAADTVGGGTRSSELTAPGLLHDECSAAHPLALNTPFSRQFDLLAHGLRWRWPDVQYATPLDGGRGAFAACSIETTAQNLAEDGDRWRATFQPLSEAFDDLSHEILQPMLHAPNRPRLLARFGLHAALPAALLGRRWRTPEAKALFAGVATHAIRPFHTAMSSAVGVTLAAAAHHHGWPVAEGGSVAITRSMISLLKERGARIHTGVRVESLDELARSEVVMLDLAPRAAVRLAATRMPPAIARALRDYRHGPAAFKVEFAIEGGVPWLYPAARQAGTVHVGGSFQEIAAAEREIHEGRMPQRPFVLVCQQYLADPTRSRGNLHPLYTYAHVPAGYPGDATSVIEAQLERFAPGFRDRIIARHVRSAADAERENANYVDGDIITGANDARQLLFRPRITRHPYATGIPGVYLCSAATPPGAGAHGMCGYNAARAALREL
jgi:phytoene dehydrogenase-like protein